MSTTAQVAPVVGVLPVDELAAKLSAHQNLYMTQKLTTEKHGMCAYTCTNRFEVYTDKSMATPVFNATEKSGCFSRVCCAPLHSFTMDIQFPDKPAPSFTITRPGKSCACCPAKCCIGCTSCCSCCLHEMTMHQSAQQPKTGCTDDPSLLIGDGAPYFTARQAPAMQSMFRPEVEVRPCSAPVTAPANIKITGPCCFGGCKEWISGSEFNTTTAEGKNVGQFKKLLPTSCGACIGRICADLDEYEFNFTPEAGPVDKSAMVTGAFLYDYMFFEGGLEILKCKTVTPCDRTTMINLCYCYCCGLTVPVRICIPWCLPCGCCGCFPGFPSCTSMCT